MSAKLVSSVPLSSCRRWLLAVFGLAFFVLACRPLLVAGEEGQPLKISTPSGWDVEHIGSGAYSIRTRGDDSGELIIMPSAPVQGDDQLRAQLDSVASSFVKEVKTSEWTKLDRYEYVLHEVKGQQFSGFYAEFTMPDKLLHAMFIISSGDQVWLGQYTGAAIHWPDALAIVKGIRKNP